MQVANNDAIPQFAEVDITVANLETEQEITLTPVLTATIPARTVVTLTGTYLIPSGLYTVSFPLFDGAGVRRDRVAGKYPLHIGVETESLRVFPEAIHLGVLPPGRYMHPTPIEVRWEFYRFNQLRQDQPHTVRVYTDNGSRYHGIPGALRRLSPAGLVHMSGRYTVPMKVWNLNYGPDIQEGGWDGQLAGPPPVDNDDFWIGPTLLEGVRNLGSANWVRLMDRVDMTATPITWRRFTGQDPYDDRFVSDLNPTGDYTLRSPFTFYLATEAGPTSVEGTYATTLIVELWSP